MNSQTAITLLKNLEQSLDGYCELNDEGKTAFNMAISALELFGISEQLPSVQPRRGKWDYTDDMYETYKCSECGFNTDDYIEYNFCPNCGCRMEEGDPDEKD